MSSVKDLMTGDVITAELPGTREDVIEILQSGDISSIPVVKDGNYRGLISREELIGDPNEDQLAMLMREVVTVDPDSSIDECAELMLESNERRIPVIENGSPIGIITLTDIVRHISKLDKEDTIGDYIDQKVLTIWQETPVQVSVEVMKHMDDTAACVLNDSGKMTGIITETDCIRMADVDTASEKIGEGVANQDDEWMWEGIKATSTQLIPVSRVTFPDKSVKEYMNEGVITVVRSTDVSEAARIMTEKKVHHLPVLKGESLVGIVKDMDLLKSLV